MATERFLHQTSMQSYDIQQEIESLSVAGDGALDTRTQRALELARRLIERSAQLQTVSEHRQQVELDRLIQNTGDKHTLTLLTDQAFRSDEACRAADQLIHILDVQGIPRFFSPLDRTLMRGFQSFGDWLPGVAVPLVKDKMRKETANVILPFDQDALSAHLRERHEQGIRMNVNMLGEALLDEHEARLRLDRYCALLSWPDIDHISVKISTIYSQISGIARTHCLDVLIQRLRTLYQTSAQHQFQHYDGSSTPKFVYLDMEEFRDLHLTADAFMQVLDTEDCLPISAGIVLQAYIPDSYPMLQRICTWAEQRQQRGGAPITIRIVKGANMEMERVEAALAEWPLPCYQQKVHTDANFKRMLHYIMQERFTKAVRAGIASHNLFDVAYAMILTYEHQCWDRVQFEMLEGMANHQRRALQELRQDILLYAPACRKEEFTNAIAYLIRRLDENTGPDNFLRHSFQLTLDSPACRKLQDTFLDSLNTELPHHGFRQQDRHQPPAMPEACSHWWTYRNEPETDFALPHNSNWAESVAERARKQNDLGPEHIPLVINGSERLTEQSNRRMIPNAPADTLCRCSIAAETDVEEAIACAAADHGKWRRHSVSKRRKILRQAAQNLRQQRSLLIACAMAETGKCLLEADLEVNEAIDFIEFYAACAVYYDDLSGVDCEALGTVCVIPPWNFPLAIPCGGMAAALAAGNTVIIKPAPQAQLCAWQLCAQFWAAGVDRQTLQFVPCDEDGAAPALVTSDAIQAHILTGGSDTAQLFYRMQPAINLHAETGGKNAMIVTAMADRDLAIKHILQSAFGHSGQKCSACSLLLLERELYDSDSFRHSLLEGARSLHAAASWELQTRVNPLADPPNDDLHWALHALDAGEQWVLQPQADPDNPQLYSPGIKYAVEPGSRSFTTEFFGPVLSVLPFQTLHEAIDIVNSNDYALTSGLQSLDDREQDIWKARIQAGNLYINRPITGAVVLRQPFGGFGASSYGPGMKAGGPNYITQFMRCSDSGQANYDMRSSDHELHQFIDHICNACADMSLQRSEMLHAADSYTWWAEQEFLRTHDHQRLIGQDNLRRYLPVDALRIRCDDESQLQALCLCILAARSVDVRCSVSIDPDCHPRCVYGLTEATLAWGGSIEILEESSAELELALESGQCLRLRWLPQSPVPAALRALAPARLCHIDCHQPLLHGRIELLRYLREQSISFDYHRYGNLGARQDEERQACREAPGGHLL